MATNVPIVRSQINWWFLMPQLLLMGLLFYGFQFVNEDFGIMIAAIIFWLISYGLRRFIPKSHYRGMQLVKKQKFNEAMPYFKKSITFFTLNSWIDNIALLF